MISYWKKLKSKIDKSKKILLSTHRNPDGDGLGSEIAFYYYLKKLGKECRIINISPMNDNYEFLDPDNIVESYDSEKHSDWILNSDLVLIFDIGDYKRLGEIYKISLNGDNFKISIDHHPSNDDYFDLKIVDVNAAATGFLVWKYFKYLELSDLDINSANALYASLISDTGSFRYNSTTSECHLMAKELLEIGVKPYYVFSNIYEQKKIKQIKLFSLILQNINYFNNNEFASVRITRKMLNDTKCTSDDVEGIADFIRSIKGVEVSFVLSELNDNTIKINFRSRGKYIINDIAQSLNGGGHQLAAGASIKNMDFLQIEEIILKQLNQKSKGSYVN